MVGILLPRPSPKVKKMTQMKETTIRTVALGIITAGGVLAQKDFVQGALMVLVGLAVYFFGHVTKD